MIRLQTVLNSILSKSVFEYILLDRDLKVFSLSDEIDKYLDEPIKKGDDVFDYLPELLGLEDEIDDIFAHKQTSYKIDTVMKKEFYFNVYLEYYSDEIIMVLLHNITEITISKQKILQQSNETTLLNKTLEKILDRQNALIFVTVDENIVYANQQFINYFEFNNLKSLVENDFVFYNLLLDDRINSYQKLFYYVNSNEKYIKIKNDTFILQSTLVEATQHLFTLSKVTNLSNEVKIDSLTGLYKKKYFTVEVEKALKDKSKFMLIVFDLDDFKKINDSYGHVSGDSVLKEFSTLIKSNIRKNDTLARWGGEEFLLILRDVDMENGKVQAQKLCNIIANHNFIDVGKVTSSLGLTYSKDNDTPDKLYQRADKALYKAKFKGKNQIFFCF